MSEVRLRMLHVRIWYGEWVVIIYEWKLSRKQNCQRFHTQTYQTWWSIGRKQEWFRIKRNKDKTTTKKQKYTSLTQRKRERKKKKKRANNCFDSDTQSNQCVAVSVLYAMPLRPLIFKRFWIASQLSVRLIFRLWRIHRSFRLDECAPRALMDNNFHLRQKLTKSPHTHSITANPFIHLFWLSASIRSFQWLMHSNCISHSCWVPLNRIGDWDWGAHVGFCSIILQVLSYVLRVIRKEMNAAKSDER